MEYLTARIIRNRRFHLPLPLQLEFLSSVSFIDIASLLLPVLPGKMCRWIELNKKVGEIVWMSLSQSVIVCTLQGLVIHSYWAYRFKKCLAFKSLQNQGICWKNTVCLSTAFKGNCYYDPFITVVMCIWQDVKNMLRNVILCTWNLLVHFIQGLRNSPCDLCSNILGSFGAPDVSSVVNHFASPCSKECVLSHTECSLERASKRKFQ